MTLTTTVLADGTTIPNILPIKIPKALASLPLATSEGTHRLDSGSEKEVLATAFGLSLEQLNRSVDNLPHCPSDYRWIDGQPTTGDLVIVGDEDAIGIMLKVVECSSGQFAKVLRLLDYRWESQSFCRGYSITFELIHELKKASPLGHFDFEYPYEDGEHGAIGKLFSWDFFNSLPREASSYCSRGSVGYSIKFGDFVETHNEKIEAGLMRGNIGIVYGFTPDFERAKVHWIVTNQPCVPLMTWYTFDLQAVEIRKNQGDSQNHHDDSKSRSATPLA